MTGQRSGGHRREAGDVAPTDTTERSIHRSLGRALLLGSLAGGAVVWAVTTALALDRGADLAAAVPFGAFVGFWGGGGLGAMVAATVPLSRYLPPPVTGPDVGSADRGRP